MRLDATLLASEIGLEPVNHMAILQRIALMGSKLEVHEYYCISLGVADVEIEQLPLSMKVGMYWNEIGQPETEIYIPLSGTISDSSSVIKQREIFLVLQKYLLPSLL